MKNHYLLFLIIALLGDYNNCEAQKLSKLNFNFNEDECYIIARGTKSKQGFIAKQFNIINDSITHIGIGIKYKDEFKIFNVNAVKNTNALTIETFESFINQEDLTYLGIWKLDLDNKFLTILKNQLAEFANKYIEFDYDFLIGNAEANLYCSEFCWIITNNLGYPYNFKLRKINTVNLGLNTILKRDILEYIPPDYFLTFPNLKFMASWGINNL